MYFHFYGLVQNKKVWTCLPIEQVLIMTMGLSFGIHDYIEAGVITAVILLNVVVGYVIVES
jgi:hypothetical protein